MAKKSITADERRHIARVVALGCLANDCGRLAEAHHPRRGMGMGQRASHYDVIPLCEIHHRTGGFGIALHMGQKTWEQKYGTEESLMELVAQKLNGGRNVEKI